MKRQTESEEANITCSFCGLDIHQLKFLFDGPGVRICDNCLAEGHAMRTSAQDNLSDVPTSCSFCSFIPALLGVSVAGRHMFQRGSASICDQCMHLCEELMQE